jgi:hypothetical protein
MITCALKFLESRCKERGYTLAEVAPCIVSRDGETVTVDVDHPAYPRAPKPKPKGGAGTELKKLLGRIGIRSKPSCSCNARAREMDSRGVLWCDNNVETVVGWLREESKRRRVPFVPLAGRLLIRRAIANARRAGYV